VIYLLVSKQRQGIEALVVGLPREVHCHQNPSQVLSFPGLGSLHFQNSPKGFGTPLFKTNLGPIFLCQILLESSIEQATVLM